MNTRLPMIFIVATLIIDSMGIGLIIPVMPQLLEEVTGLGLAEAAIWGGLLTAVFAAMQFLCGPLIGNLSDRFGRRPVLLASLFALGIDYLVMAAAGTIWLLLAGRVVSGITAATPATANAFVADISKPAEKAARFGLLGAAFGTGFVLGPMMGGLLAGYGTRAPFIAAAVLALANTAFGYFVMPETVTREKRRSFSLRRANPLGAFAALGHLKGFTWLFALTFVMNVANMVYPAIWPFWGAERFGWSPGQIGLSLTVYGMAVVVSQAVIVKPAIAKLGEVRAIFAALVIGVISLSIFGFIASGPWAMALVVVSSLGGIGWPALMSLMSSRTPADQQGELQGLLTSLGSAAAFVSPPLMTWVFFRFSRDGASIYLPGAPYLLAAILTLACIALFVFGNARETAQSRQ